MNESTDIPRIRLAHGGGGRETSALLSELIAPRFKHPALSAMNDAALLPGKTPLAFTTDSFVVKPLFFSGGNIGKLAVCGTVNDLSMMGAVPTWLSLALILEEGFPIADLETILDTIAAEANAAGIEVVCGDTKVVDKGAADGLFINTSGIGLLREGINLSAEKAKVGDSVIVSGPVGDHGIAILAARKELGFITETKSDCACLNGLVDALLKSGVTPRTLRDATRGGLSAVVNELALASQTLFEIEESTIPVRPSTASACQLLGFSPWDLANEGTMVAVVPKEQTEKALQSLRAHPLGKGAECIGRVKIKGPFPAVLVTPLGTPTLLEMPRGELLPRIC